jgi:hypothetical protein
MQGEGHFGCPAANRGWTSFPKLPPLARRTQARQIRSEEIPVPNATITTLPFGNVIQTTIPGATY